MENHHGVAQATVRWFDPAEKILMLA